MSLSREYRFEQVVVSEVDLEQVYNLFVESFGNDLLAKDIIRWQYAQNPLGNVVGFNAFSGDQLAAHYVTIPTQAWRSGILKRGLLSINTATHPQHQKQGLFTKLAELTYALGSELGYSYVVGVANQNSVHGFTRKLGFQHVEELERRFVFSKISRFEFSVLDFAGAWSQERLAWRLAHPTKLNSYAAQKTEHGWNILGRTGRFLGLVGAIDEDSLPPNILKTSSPILPRQWIGLDAQINWSKTLNLRVPRRFEPIPLHLIFKSLENQETLDAKSLRFWALDFDAY